MALLRLDRVCVLKQTQHVMIGAPPGAPPMVKTTVVEGKFTSTLVNTSTIHCVDYDDANRLVINMGVAGARVLDYTMDEFMGMVDTAEAASRWPKKKAEGVLLGNVHQLNRTHPLQSHGGEFGPVDPPNDEN